MKNYQGTSSTSNHSHYTKIPSYVRLIFLGIIIITPAITPGMSIGYSAVALPQLNLSVDETSWFASIASIATPIGNLCTGSIIDRYGRRPALISSIIPSILGWAILYKSSNLQLLYIGRMLTGFALGAASLPSSIYAAECITIHNNHLRGSLTTWTTLAISGGTLLVYTLGSLLKYNQVAAIAAIISTISLVLIFFFIPESPAWLYRKGRKGDAEWSQRRLGISQPILLDSNEEASLICEATNTSFSLQESVPYFKMLQRKDIYKPLLITIVFLFFLQFSGVYVLTSYMVSIINTEFSDRYLSSYFLTVIAGIIQFLGATLISFIIPYSGIRKLATFSCAGVTIGMLLLALSSTINLSFQFKITLDIIHIVAVWITVFMSGLGFIAIPFSLLGEVFPPDAKSFASISLIASSLFNFIILKVHPYLYLDIHGFLYYIYAAISLFGTLFVAFFVPETVGKTLEEIKDDFLNVPSIKISQW